MSDLIYVHGLSKTYGSEFQALKNVDLNIREGEILALLGPNGAGKTTTFNMLSGILPPTKGDAFIFGKSVRRQLRSVQAMMGLCPQHDVLWAELSANEHLQLFAGLSGIPAAEVNDRIQMYLKQVDLDKWQHSPSKKFSGGMKSLCRCVERPTSCGA